MGDSLGDRMKDFYEGCYKIKLPRRMPLIIRLDGKAFHTFTRQFKKPYDNALMGLMNKTACHLCSEIQGAQMAYVQSDEISILTHNYKRLESGAWFENDLQKIVSVSAGLASSFFTHAMFSTFEVIKHVPVVFDARAFVLPEAEVANYFIWRQKDWERNSVAMLAQSLFSHKELLNKSKEKQKEMCFLKGHKWEDLSEDLKNGRMILKVPTTNDWEAIPAPVFTKDRYNIEYFLKTEEVNNEKK